MFNNFFTNSNNTEKDSFVWNLIGSSLNAFQSVIMLAIITRVTTLNDAGAFSIAYANSILLLNIGKYGMRNFQVSDYNSAFSFNEYLKSRIFTSLMMILCSTLYIIIISKVNSYSSYKSLVIFFMCLYKSVDSIEDVYHGLFQKNNRLDIAGKALSFRIFLSMVVFAVALICTKSLLASLIITTLFSTLLCIYLLNITYPAFKKKEEAKYINIISLLKICFPLFLSTFLSFYINNSPKYAIDSILNDDLQACYGFIFMPVFIIELMSSFLFNPVIFKMTKDWESKNLTSLKKKIYRQILLIFGITVICEAAAYFAGIPVLSLLYNTNLNNYKTDLIILLLGGCAYALSALFITVLTIMRKQKQILLIYATVSAFALIISKQMVKKYSLAGASYLYLFLMLFLFALSFFLTFFTLSRKKTN